MKVSEEIDALENHGDQPHPFSGRPKVPGHDGHVCLA